MNHQFARQSTAALLALCLFAPMPLAAQQSPQSASSSAPQQEQRGQRGGGQRQAGAAANKPVPKDANATHSPLPSAACASAPSALRSSADASPPSPSIPIIARTISLPPLPAAFGRPPTQEPRGLPSSITKAPTPSASSLWIRKIPTPFGSAPAKTIASAASAMATASIAATMAGALGAISVSKIHSTSPAS